MENKHERKGKRVLKKTWR